MPRISATSNSILTSEQTASQSTSYIDTSLFFYCGIGTTPSTSADGYNRGEFVLRFDTKGLKASQDGGVGEVVIDTAPICVRISGDVQEGQTLYLNFMQSGTSVAGKITRSSVIRYRNLKIPQSSTTYTPTATLTFDAYTQPESTLSSQYYLSCQLEALFLP